MGKREIDYLICKNVEKKLTKFKMSHTLERKVLHDEVSKRIGLIDGKFKGAKSHTAEKNQAWHSRSFISKHVENEV